MDARQVARRTQALATNKLFKPTGIERERGMPLISPESFLGTVAHWLWDAVSQNYKSTRSRQKRLSLSQVASPWRTLSYLCMATRYGSVSFHACGRGEEDTTSMFFFL